MEKSNGGEIHPGISLEIANTYVEALLDTGSAITVISEKFYNRLKNSDQLHMLDLPFRSVDIICALGQRKKLKTKQIAVEIKIQDFRIFTQFLVIPHLISDVILGRDWMKENHVDLLLAK